MKKKERRNGFTLIELLAVIIILGIVALIATPIVLNVVENAQRKAFEQSAQGYYDAARYVYNDMMLREDKQDIMFTFEDGAQRSDNPNYKLEVQGEVPKKGLVYLAKDGEVLVSIANDKWCATTNGSGTIELTDDPNACEYAPEECYTFSDFIPSKDTIVAQHDVFTDADYADGWINETLLQVDSFDKENPLCKGLVIIPNEYNGRKVEGIKSEVFSFNTNINGVILSSGIRIVDEAAFGDTINIKQLVMNDGLRYIGGYSFTANKLVNVKIPSSVVYIGEFAFGENEITNVNIPYGITSIDNQVFTDNKLTNITIPDSVTSIGYGAFENNQLTSITIPKSVTSIGADAFKTNRFPNASSITILGDNPNRFDSNWTDIGFPAK